MSVTRSIILAVELVADAFAMYGSYLVVFEDHPQWAMTTAIFAGAFAIMAVSHVILRSTSGSRIIGVTAIKINPYILRTIAEQIERSQQGAAPPCPSESRFSPLP